MENIVIKTNIAKPVSEVWEYFTKPEHITHWNFATEDWMCPVAKTDFREGGKFSYTMEAKDKSFVSISRELLIKLMKIKRFNTPWMMAEQWK